MKGRFLRTGAGFLTVISLIINMPAATIINDCSEANLRTAMATGGHIIFNCDGTIVLGGPLAVTADTVLDARGHNVVISGNDAVRLFVVSTDNMLTLYDLTLTRGRDQGTNGAFGQPGGSASAGAILLQAGGLHADGCRFLTNRTIGGKGGDGGNVGMPPLPVPAREGGNARGGAIFADQALV